MGYMITIGPAKLSWDKTSVRVRAGSLKHGNAPDHCPYTGKGNTRNPSSNAWSAFCREVGIYDMFYGENEGSTWSSASIPNTCPKGFYRETPILANRFGAQPITKADVTYIKEALRKYTEKHPGVEPVNWREKDIGTDQESALSRLIWLDFWIEYVVENCENPVIANS